MDTFYNLYNLFGGRQQSYDEKNYMTGITRKKINNHFEYFYIKDNSTISKKDLERINKLGIPPAWENVWISPDSKSSIQVVGTDSKGRKQYRYNQKHIEKAEQKKFLRLYDFINALPKLERVMKKHEKLGPYNKERVIVSMLIIIRELHMRVGKEVYARENKSYGVSSLKKIHMKFDGDKILFRFKGKSNQKLFYSLDNEKLKNHLKLLLKLEGDKLFQYIDENNKVRAVTDTDLNGYIQQWMGPEFTAKDFRTYAANHYFIKALLKETKKRYPKDPKIMKKNILAAIKSTAFYLRHTRAISKKSYVINFAVNLYQNNPDFFVQRKEMDPNNVLLEILQLYKKKIIKISRLKNKKID